VRDEEVREDQRREVNDKVDSMGHSLEQTQGASAWPKDESPRITRGECRGAGSAGCQNSANRADTKAGAAGTAARPTTRRTRRRRVEAVEAAKRPVWVVLSEDGRLQVCQTVLPTRPGELDQLVASSRPIRRARIRDRRAHRQRHGERTTGSVSSAPNPVKRYLYEQLPDIRCSDQRDQLR
jgi:hypothetical protein